MENTNMVNATHEILEGFTLQRKHMETLAKVGV